MHDTFAQRRLRVRYWLGRDVPAEPMLELYLEILDLQEPLCHRVPAAADGVAVTDRVKLLVGHRLADFGRFVRQLASAGTEPLVDAGEVLGAADAALLGELLETCLERRDSEPIAAEIGVDPAPAEFYARAFLEPFLEPLAAAAAPPAGGTTTCPYCGWLPRVGLLRDEPDVRGRRLLECSLCSTRWPSQRSMCAHCRETAAEKLLVHTSEWTPHVRIEECETCRGYLKTVDLREDGLAVPVVDDLATVELDLWADERGLVKIERNLLGI